MTYQKPSYKRQVIAAFSSMANCNFGQKFDKESDPDIAARTAVMDAINIKGPVKEFIHEKSDPWYLVWGPKTSNSKSSCKWHCDNTMYIVKTESFDGGVPLYVVAIAGTNAISPKGWLVEDLNVWSQYKWPTKSRAGKISSGTHIGVDILMNDLMDKSQTIGQFFQNLDLTKQGKPYEIAVCGHSLGGALSPVVALMLKEWTIKIKRKNITVGAYPSAGATPGNGHFAKYYEKTMGADNFHSIINAHDMVPHAWEPKMLKMIPGLYKDYGITVSKKIAHIMNDVANTLNVRYPFQHYTRLFKDKEKSTTFLSKPNPKNKECKDFGQEAIYQHTVAYAEYGFQWPDDVREQLTAIQRHASPA